MLFQGEYFWKTLGMRWWFASTLHNMHTQTWNTKSHTSNCQGQTHSNTDISTDILWSVSFTFNSSIQALNQYTKSNIHNFQLLSVCTHKKIHHSLCIFYLLFLFLWALFFTSFHTHTCIPVWIIRRWFYLFCVFTQTLHSLSTNYSICTAILDLWKKILRSIISSLCIFVCFGPDNGMLVRSTESEAGRKKTEKGRIKLNSRNEDTVSLSEWLYK